MTHEVKVNYRTIIETILDEIRKANIENRKIVQIGLPRIEAEELQDYLMRNMNIIKRKNKGKIRKGQIGEAFGVPIISSDTLQITTEFSRFLPL